MQSGRRAPVAIEGSERVIPCDTVIVAVGTRANPLLTSSSPDLALTDRGYLAADESGMTNLPGVFAGGDIVRGSATVILAMGDGKRIAGTIDNYLRRDQRRRHPSLGIGSSAPSATLSLRRRSARWRRRNRPAHGPRAPGDTPMQARLDGSRGRAHAC